MLHQTEVDKMDTPYFVSAFPKIYLTERRRGALQYSNFTSISKYKAFMIEIKILKL